MYSEDDFIPVSAVGQIAFCERRCALMFIEDIWEENRFTVEGAQLHEQVHEAETESRGDVRIARSLLLKSERYGLSGKADVVEFHRVVLPGAGCPLCGGVDRNVSPGAGVALPGVPGLWMPFPVEYKHGELREEESYKAQLCAQALCLEEMLGTPVRTGAIFYDKPRRRLDVTFDAPLRAQTERHIERVHELFRTWLTPRVAYEPKCRSCSLFAQCMPKTTGTARDVGRYLAGAFVPPPHEGVD